MGLISTIVSLVGAAVIGWSGPSVGSPPPTAPAVGVWPLEPATVVRSFSPPEGTWATGHRGVDIAGTVGAPVRASLAGTVAFAGTLAGRGVVVIRHGDTRTTYEPLIPGVNPGDVVAAGTQIGTLDVTQSHCFPAACLHWGWLRGDDYLNPLDLVAAASPVRLLPLTLPVMPSGEPDGTRS